MSQTTYNKKFEGLNNVYEWYIPEDLSRNPPVTFAQAEKRRDSLEQRWKKWDDERFDPTKGDGGYVRDAFKGLDPLNLPELRIQRAFRTIFSTKKNKEYMLKKLRIEQEFKDRVFTRTEKERLGLAVTDHHRQKRRHYWQTYDEKKDKWVKKDYNLFKTELRTNETSVLRGDERFHYLEENLFQHDNCEFTPWFQHILKVRRKWRKEPKVFRPISMYELRKHRFPNDCWTMIRGQVYDITSFIYSHSGGDLPLRQVFGEDGTWVLLGVHPYIVWYQNLSSIEVGRKPGYKRWGWTVYEPIHQFDGFDLLQEWMTRKPHPLKEFYPIETFRQDERRYYISIEFPTVANSTGDHWMFAILDNQYIRIQFYFEGTDVWYGHLKLPRKVNNDIPYWNFSKTFNKCTLSICKMFVDRKIPKTKLAKLDDHGFFFSNNTLQYLWLDAYIVKKAYLAEDVILVTLGYDMSIYLGCPIGFYVNIQINDSIRPYTPIYFPIVAPENESKKPGRRGRLTFIVRLKKHGELSPLIFDTPKDQGGRIAEMKISPAQGIFDVKFMFDGMDIMLILAGGTGIAPFIRILQLYRQKALAGQMNGKHVFLLYFNRKESDIIFGKSFDFYQDEGNGWFHYYPVLTQAPPGPDRTWKGLNGKPSRSLIMRCLNEPKGVYSKAKKLKIMVCGRYNFTHRVESELASLKLTDIKNQFCFLGDLDDDTDTYGFKAIR